MGAVYKARDLRLKRLVALKVLPPEATADPARVRRFVDEARAASGLSHPGIVTVFDVGDEQGVRFIAMELVTGRTLEEVLHTGPLRLADALRYAVEIADAVASAHAAGVVHRDLKPGNVMVSEDGRVKVLDFGLAKLLEPDESGSATTTATRGPRTEQGTVLGTAAYMSPEQAEGRPVDHRSDIFSFGTMLYEMVTGQHPFRRETRLSTLSAIVYTEPKAPAEIVAGLPSELERVIRRCLRKDPAQRFQGMADLKVALAEVLDEMRSAVPSAAPTQPRRAGRRRWLWWSLGAVGVLALVAPLLRRAAPQTEYRLAQITFDAGLSYEPSLSADGKTVAYASDRATGTDMDVWIQRVDGGDALRLTQSPADEDEPSLSPDGLWVAFRSDADQGIHIVSANGGPPRLLAKGGHFPSFSPDGRQVAYLADPPGPINYSDLAWLQVVPASGGSPTRLASDLRFLPTARRPLWMPDGAALLLLGRTGGSDDWWTVPVAGEAATNTHLLSLLRKTVPSAGDPHGWIGDRLVFSGATLPQGRLPTLPTQSSLWAIPFDSKAVRFGSTPTRLTFGTGIDTEASTSSAGAIAFRSGGQRADVWSLPLPAGEGGGAGEPRRLTHTAAVNFQPDVSPDGRTLAFLAERNGVADVWLMDLATGGERPLTASPETYETAPRFSPDGQRIALVALGAPGSPETIEVRVLPTAGGPPLKTCRIVADPRAWTPDGQSLLVETGADYKPALLDLESCRIDILGPDWQTSSIHYMDDITADGRFILYSRTRTNEGGCVVAAPFKGSRPLVEAEQVPLVSEASSANYPKWSPDGRAVFFQSNRDGHWCLWARRVDVRSKHPLGEPFAVRHLHSHRLSLSAPGSPFFRREMDVSREGLFFTMTETTGNIWLLVPTKK
jgi:Tol biopolymer transport system component